MVDFSLAEARSSRYGHAASHQAYMAAIGTGHGRKSAFWQRMQELGLS
ncbi:MAG: hypothetical protein ACNA8O_01740 [Cyanobacteriota bacterium]